MSCPDCERYKLSASMWRNKAYELAGTPLPWEPEELLRKEYERGYADAMNWKVQNHLEHLPTKDEWVGLTDEEQQELYKKHSMDGWGLFYDAIEAKLKEKNT